MKIIDLLVKIANGEKVPKKIRINDVIYEYRGYMYCTENANYQDIQDYLFGKWNFNILNDEVEILEEENELHANSVEFNVSYDKRDCVITLDENDLGIDKLHLDNCYFYKENDKWYVKKYDFKSFKLEKEKKIPEKLEIIEDGGDTGINDEYMPYKQFRVVSKKINEIIDYLDYLKSKGE